MPGRDLRAHFKNFDDPEEYEKVKAHGRDPAAQNFVVQFGANKAEVARDLDFDAFKALLNSKKDAATPIRWMYVSAARLLTAAVRLEG